MKSKIKKEEEKNDEEDHVHDIQKLRESSLREKNEENSENSQWWWWWSSRENGRKFFIFPLRSERVIRGEKKNFSVSSVDDCRPSCEHFKKKASVNLNLHVSLTEEKSSHFSGIFLHFRDRLWFSRKRKVYVKKFLISVGSDYLCSCVNWNINLHKNCNLKEKNLCWKLFNWM